MEKLNINLYKVLLVCEQRAHLVVVICQLTQDKEQSFPPVPAYLTTLSKASQVKQLWSDAIITKLKCTDLNLY